MKVDTDKIDSSTKKPTWLKNLILECIIRLSVGYKIAIIIIMKTGVLSDFQKSYSK